MNLQINLHQSIAEIRREEWDACAPGHAEGWAYLHAAERASIPGFDLFYVSVREVGRLVACAPGFVTDYGLDTTVQGPVKAATQAIRKLMPRLLTLRLASLGSPVTQDARLCVAPGRSPDEEQALYEALIDGLRRQADLKKARLTAIKDIPESLASARKAAASRGLIAMSSLPEAALDLSDIHDEDAYWASLSASTRKDLRRKLKKAKDVQIERVADIRPYAADIDALYAATRARSELQFEVLDHRYFEAVLEEMGECAAFFLYRVEGRIIAFNLMVESKGALVDKYFCSSEDGAAYNLYFVSWLHNVRYAISRGVQRLEAGQSTYEPKLRLRCRLEPTTIFFQHGGRMVNAALRLASQYLDVKSTDPTLKGLAIPA